jgi:hypothetical protein
MLLRRVALPDFCEPCLPSPADKPPAGAGWLHEIKHDGFRMLVRREHSRKPEEAYEMIELMTQSFAVARSFVIP